MNKNKNDLPLFWFHGWGEFSTSMANLETYEPNNAKTSK